MKFLSKIVIYIVVFVAANCAAANDLECFDGDIALYDLIEAGVKKGHEGKKLDSLTYIKFNRTGSGADLLIRAYVEGIVTNGESRRYGYAHWIAKLSGTAISGIKSVTGNATTYFNFSETTIETEVDLYELGYWSQLQKCRNAEMPQ